MEKQIKLLETQIKHLADQLNVTKEYCLEQYETRKNSANTEAILGIAWQCLDQAKKIHQGEGTSILEQFKMRPDEFVTFYLCKAADAFGMAKIEAVRLNPILDHQREATKSALKYDKAYIRLWNELADKIDPKKELSNIKIAELIAKELELSSKAIQSIRKSIRQK